MKRLTTALLLAFASLWLHAQENKQNYIQTRTLLNAAGSSYVENISYHDGLGRPFQVVGRAVENGALKGSVLATLQEYDSAGRESSAWLPTVISGNYLEATAFKSQAVSQYGDTYPYTQPIYESSPLNRPVSQYGAGAAWRTGNHSVKKEYLLNTASDNAKHYSIGSNGNPVDNGDYAFYTLQVVKATDEDGKVGYTFTDKLGKVVLERRMNGAEPLDTYYVYDDKGNLRFVLQPEYQNSTAANKLELYAFRYSYNDWNLCEKKELPGADSILYRYNDRQLLSFSQDGNQRASGKWTYYLYDGLCRLTEQGECSNTATLGNKVVHLKNYYDKYGFVGDTGFAGGRFSNDLSGYSRGSLTGTVMAVLGSTDKIYIAYYYDIRGRMHKKVQSNLLGGYDVTTTTYTFTDKPLTVTHEHTASGKASRTEVYTYTYDEKDRLNKIMHKLGTTEVTLASYTYDNKGRMASKKLHGSSTNTLTYSYNIRNWLTGISSTKFTQTLGYGSHYNGNISSMNWTANGTSHAYTFNYDGVNRMLNATHGTGTYTEKVTSYDKNGNIKALQRYGNGLIDNLTYTYSGNQLTRVDDATGNAAGFSNGASAANEYTYDKNGNLTKDSNKGITNIAYNCLNLPSKVTFSDGNTIVYTYAADGTKLRTVHTISGTTTTKNYCSNVIYEDDNQKLLLTEEGYVDLSNSSYYYYLKDHQGNNRVVVSSGGTVAEVNHYYPFGGVFASNNNVQPYKYNGKELDTKKGLNWYDYGARHYDAALGRWFAVDPLAEKYYAWSPYVYCYNNPIKFVDVDGKFGESIWDISSLLIGVKSFSDNIKSGNIDNAIVDGVGIVFDAVAVALPVVPGGVGAGIKAVRATDDVVDVVTTANKSNNVMKNRVKLRKGTKEAVKDLAPKTGEGLFVDPNTNLPIEKGQEVFGHKKGQEWSKYKNDPVNKNKTRKEVIEDQNNPEIYQIEDKKSNASHKYEEKWK